MYYALEMLKIKALGRKRGSKELMIELGLTIVAVVLLITFRTQMTTLLTTISSFVTDKIKALFTAV